MLGFQKHQILTPSVRGSKSATMPSHEQSETQFGMLYQGDVFLGVFQVGLGLAAGIILTYVFHILWRARHHIIVRRRHGVEPR
jgi:hypothetical protein